MPSLQDGPFDLGISLDDRVVSVLRVSGNRNRHFDLANCLVASKEQIFKPSGASIATQLAIYIQAMVSESMVIDAVLPRRPSGLRWSLAMTTAHAHR
jgi:hypothetical protein